MDHTFGVVSKNASPNERSLDFSLVLYDESFMTLCYTVRCITHFHLIFVTNCCSITCGKDYSTFSELLLLLCQRPFDFTHVVLFLGTLFCSLIYVTISLFTDWIANITLLCSLNNHSFILSLYQIIFIF